MLWSNELEYSTLIRGFFWRTEGVLSLSFREGKDSFTPQEFRETNRHTEIGAKWREDSQSRWGS
jgi:hypothetical protein